MDSADSRPRLPSRWAGVGAKLPPALEQLVGPVDGVVDAALPVCARYGLGVAGGYAVKAHGLVERPSEDIDFATGAAAPIEEIVAALAAAYRSVGFEVQVLDAEGRKGHLLVTFPLGGTYRVDVLKEPLNHPVVWMEFGPVIALADTVALKMGALHDSTCSVRPDTQNSLPSGAPSVGRR
jgi:hypothetical protein